MIRLVKTAIFRLISSKNPKYQHKMRRVLRFIVRLVGEKTNSYLKHSRHYSSTPVRHDNIR